MAVDGDDRSVAPGCSDASFVQRAVDPVHAVVVPVLRFLQGTKLLQRALAVVAAGVVLAPTAAGAADPDRILATRGGEVVDLGSGAVVTGVSSLWIGSPAVAQSPDGSRLAVGTASATWRELGELVLSGADGACRTPVPSVDDVRGLSWAPDSVRLALGNRGEIRVLDTGRPGATPQRLTSAPVQGSFPSWHPTAERIAFARPGAGSTTGLAVVDARTGTVTTLVDLPGNESEPAWSPDGHQVAFVRHQAETSTLHVVDAGGTGERALGATVPNPRSPSWSRDGRTLLVSGTTDSRSNGVWRVDVATGGATRLSADELHAPIEAPLGAREGYLAVASSGQAYGFGASCSAGPSVRPPVVGAAAVPGWPDHWQVNAAGEVRTPGGTLPHFGDLQGRRLNQPIVGILAGGDAGGYWLVARDGGIFSFGQRRFHGSTGAMRLNQPIVGGAATPTGSGYWLVASDGGIFSFGDARFFGSTGSMKLNQPIVGMQPTPTGNGYWLVARDGGIFSFGDARFFGSTGSIKLNQPITGMAVVPGGGGYWLVAADGGIFSFGAARFRGSVGGTPVNGRVVALLPERFE